LISFSERLCALSQPSVIDRSRSLPVLLTHIMLQSNALPYIRDVLVISLGGDEVHLNDLPQLMSSRMRSYQLLLLQLLA
jgi:hypothetical protein